MELKKCRLCKSSNLVKFLKLGETALANRYLKEEELKSGELKFPLELSFCNECSFVQLSYVVDPKIMFSTYLYVSSTMQSFRDHFKKFAEELKKRFELGENTLVIDVGSNDGVFLKPLKELGVKTLGIDPAANVAEIAKKEGVETVVGFFNKKTAAKILQEMGKAKVITASNVFTHIHNIDDVIKGVDVLLDDDGAFIVEVYYVGSIMESMYFDLVYHEHLSYFTAITLSKLFARFGMEVFDIQKVPTHGGSLRVFVKRKGSRIPVSSSVQEFITAEKEKGLDSFETYKDFASRVEKTKEKLNTLLRGIKAQGKTIAGYGAPAKATTLLNYCGIGKEVLDFIVDKSPLKQGLYMPGNHIPILPENTIFEKKPEYVLILAWNFANEIMQKETRYKEMGGRFIVPLPEPKIF